MTERSSLSNPQESGECSSVFAQFTFEPLQNPKPPRTKGVYVVRIAARGEPVARVAAASRNTVARLSWPMVERKMLSRISRLTKINNCPIIYIGSAGTAEASKHTLHGRYTDLANRHTAMYPIWALLYVGWSLEFGWSESTRPDELGGQLKDKYRAIHQGLLPALVEK